MPSIIFPAFKKTHLFLLLSLDGLKTNLIDRARFTVFFQTGAHYEPVIKIDKKKILVGLNHKELLDSTI